MTLHNQAARLSRSISARSPRKKTLKLPNIESIRLPKETGFYQTRMKRMQEKQEERQRQEVSRKDPSVAYEK
jgi:hypothetical protein